MRIPVFHLVLCCEAAQRALCAFGSVALLEVPSPSYLICFTYTDGNKPKVPGAGGGMGRANEGVVKRKAKGQ